MAPVAPVAAAPRKVLMTVLFACGTIAFEVGRLAAVAAITGKSSPAGRLDSTQFGPNLPSGVLAALGFVEMGNITLTSIMAKKLTTEPVVLPKVIIYTFRTVSLLTLGRSLLQNRVFAGAQSNRAWLRGCRVLQRTHHVKLLFLAQEQLTEAIMMMMM